jgi:hypothetical protein
VARDIVVKNNSRSYSNLTLGEAWVQAMKDVKSQASRNAVPGKQGGLNAEIQSRIGHQLRAMYDDVVRQGVPDRFAELIRKLDVPKPDPQLGNTGDPEDGRS